MNPYRDLPDTAFWRRSVSPLGAEVDPITAPKFQIGRSDRVVSAGSCFAQHIARALQERGFDYLITEPGPRERNYGVFSARFGNLYTVRQLHQLFRRAYGLFEPSDDIWTSPQGRFIDPFRPAVEPDGFASEGDLRADRDRHLLAVRQAFERMDVFIFTLGLTEAWVSTVDGAVYPFAPGVVANGESRGVTFKNFNAFEMLGDIRALIASLRRLRPGIRVLLTVSPVPLIATYSKRHVLTATTYSKASLRVVAEEAGRDTRDTDYFPSYEIIAAHPSRGAYFAEDLREVTEAGVNRVMALFDRHYLDRTRETGAPKPVPARPSASGPQADVHLRAIQDIICDEALLDP